MTSVLGSNKKDLLVVFNTCGITRENPVEYADHIRTILNQSCNFTLAVSACCNSDDCREYVLENTKSGLVEPEQILYNDIRQILPVSITFNHTVKTAIKKYGEFANYMFIDSGISLSSNDDLLSLLDLHGRGYGMTSARTDEDTGINDWFGVSERGDELFSNHLIIPVGKAINLHAQIFSGDMYKTYGNILPDIFAGQCMESTFSFLCAALKKKWVVHKDIILRHKTGMDGPSSGFSPAKWVSNGKKRWDHLFGTDESILDIIARGYEYGMGYEENQKIVVHRDECFEDNLCKNDELAKFIRDNLYLQSKFDYNSIESEVTNG